MSGPSAAVLGLPGPVLEGADRAFLRAADPWGVILFARNLRDPAQLARLTADIRDALGRDAPILVDQEGGRVARLRGPHWTEWPSPATAAARPTAEAAITLRHRLMAAELAAVGIDVNCAPCADIAGPATHPFLADRCYGTTARAVTRHARAAADGLLSGGVLPVVKHLPGHGRATADSHFALPVVEAALADLAEDFAPFAALADLPMAMTAHVVFAALDDRPATCAPPVIALIRDRIGFAGLLVTDDLGMQALSGAPAQRAADAIAAGCDIALYGNGDAATLRAVAEAAGPLTPAAQARADAALARRRLPPAAEARARAAALTAELAALDAGQIARPAAP